MFAQQNNQTLVAKLRNYIITWLEWTLYKYVHTIKATYLQINEFSQRKLFIGFYWDQSSHKPMTINISNVRYAGIYNN